jgi:citrate synthase
MLDVKRQTLYAYVSRGWLRSRGVSGSRRREYHVDDLRRLAARSDARAGHTAVAAGALRWGEPVLDSSITHIRPDGPAYRDHLATALAEGDAGFEAVAELLWTRRDPSQGPVAWPSAPFPLPVRRLAALLGEAARPLDALATVLPLLAVRDPDRHLATPEATTSRARTLLRTCAVAIALPVAPQRIADASEAPTIARAMLVAFGVRPTARATRALETALILLADHELNASAFAARVAASASADVYACISAALATLSGPAHGGMTERVAALVDEVGRPERAAAVLRERLRRGDPIPGFGHRLYDGGDPRTPPLLAAARALAPRRVAAMSALVDAMALAGGEGPTVDLGLVALAAALRLPPGAPVAIFAIGRMAGWIAHAIEQRDAGYLLRPRARYVDAASPTPPR